MPTTRPLHCHLATTASVGLNFSELWCHGFNLIIIRLIIIIIKLSKAIVTIGILIIKTERDGNLKEIVWPK